MHHISRRTFLASAPASAALLPGTAAVAQSYPEKPIRMIIPIAPGGSTDLTARLLQMTIDRTKTLPQPLVIVNNAAAGGTTGTRQVKDADPDGYTLGMFHMGMLTAPAMGVVDYDHTAFDLIGQVGRVQVGMGVLESSKYKSMKELIDAAKAQPNTITVAMNIGLLPHFVPLMFQQDAGIAFRYVQSGGGAIRLKSLLGNHTEASLFAVSEFIAYKAQGIRPLVVFSEKRAPELPDVPTAQELGYNTVFGERAIAFAPKGTPKPRIDIIAKALKDAMDDPEVVKKYAELGLDRVFLDGPALKAELDAVKDRIFKVGESVKAAQKESAEKKP
jgi:putative tricarboxylic transport membrane protein